MSLLNEIKNCDYISSVGVLKLLDDLDLITYGDGVVDVAHRVTYDFTKISKGKDGVCIYIKLSHIHQFFNDVFPYINYKFILITGDGDETMPFDIFNIDYFFNLINQDKIIHWFSVNCIQDVHPKLSLIPIGVNFHSSSFGQFCGWHETKMSPLEQESLIKNIREKSHPFDKRIIKCYSNFHFVTYPEFGNPRKDAIENIPPDLVFYEPTFVDRVKTWENQSEYSFVISPMGHGMDCHRTWEALMLGCIVVVKRSPLDPLYEDLPVLIVDNWADISEVLLENTIDIFKKTKFDYNKITSKYWVDKIKNCHGFVQ